MSSPTDPVPDDRRRRVTRRAVVAVAAATAGLLVVPALTGTEPEAAAAELVPFTGCDDVEQWYRDQALDLVGPWGLQGPDAGGSWLGRVLGAPGGQDDALAGIAESAAESAAEAADGVTGGAVGPGETGTNVQEQGVDEPDLVKTDGRRVVTLSGNAVHVVDTDGGRLRSTGSVSLDGQWLSELLLLGDRALVVGQREPQPVEPAPLPEPGLPEPSEDGGSDAVVPSPPPVESWAPTTVLSVLDLTADGGPRLVRTEEVEASYLSARVVGDAVRVVLGSTPAIPFPQPEYDADGSIDEDAAEEANRAAIESMTAAEWLPQRVVRDADGSVLSREPAVDCASLAHPVDSAGLGTVTVLTLDAGAADVPTVDTDAVSADGGMVYASADRLYVATTRGGWGFPVPVDVRIGTTVVSSSTQLHGFDITDPARTEYLGSGSVPGWLLGRWAMSAQDGMLRVATTAESAEHGTEAVVTVLAERDGDLVETGSVGGLGKGEEIRAVRWFGDLAVVVTFRQTDPLYTVDLSDPAAPAVVGELKIPGYSAYLHPLGDDLLLGVGQDATETGQVTGAQVSSFDLRDLAAPARIDTLTYRDAWTDVEGESRAFSYLPERRLALLPLAAGGSSGVVGVSVARDGTLTETGRWTTDREAWVLRATPVGERVVVLAEGAGDGGRTLTLLATDGLTELDTLPLPPR